MLRTYIIYYCEISYNNMCVQMIRDSSDYLIRDRFCTAKLRNNIRNNMDRGYPSDTVCGAIENICTQYNTCSFINICWDPKKCPSLKGCPLRGGVLYISLNHSVTHYIFIQTLYNSPCTAAGLHYDITLNGPTNSL